MDENDLRTNCKAWKDEATTLRSRNEFLEERLKDADRIVGEKSRLLKKAVEVMKEIVGDENGHGNPELAEDFLEDHREELEGLE